MKIKHIRFKTDTVDALDKEAKKLDRSVSWLVRHYVKRGLSMDNLVDYLEDTHS